MEEMQLSSRGVYPVHSFSDAGNSVCFGTSDVMTTGPYQNNIQPSNSAMFGATLSPDCASFDRLPSCTPLTDNSYFTADPRLGYDMTSPVYNDAPRSLDSTPLSFMQHWNENYPPYAPVDNRMTSDYCHKRKARNT